MAYIDNYGVEFTDNKQTIIRCPKNFKGHYTIPFGVHEIESEAFKGCEDLTSIEIPNSVEYIKQKAFAGCNLKSLFIPRSIIEIADMAFFNNPCLESIYLSEGINKIGNYAFASEESCYFHDFRLLEIPSSIREIGIAAFRRYNHHAEDFYAIGGRVIEHYAAYNETVDKVEILIVATDLNVHWSGLVGTNLETVILKEGVMVIPICGFDGCKILHNVIIPSTIRTIGEFAFRECELLETLILPSNINELWSNSLPPNIKKVVLKSGKLKLRIGVYEKERLSYYIDNKVFVDVNGNFIMPEVIIYRIGKKHDNGTFYYEGMHYDIIIVDDFEEP